MRWLFVFAHPDDESVAAGGTIRKLVNFGDEVYLALATNGEGGKIKRDEILSMRRKEFENLDKVDKRRYVKKVRKKEFKKACEVLGIKKCDVFGFSDGEINNETVWGDLTASIIKSIEELKPDFLVTFDHTGWYYHLDHVGVSLATIKAMQKAKYKVDGIMFNVFHPPGMKNKWKYHYPKEFPITHKVYTRKERNIKIQALKCHMSQDISLIDNIEKGLMDEEYFELVSITKKGRELMKKRSFFELVGKK